MKKTMQCWISTLMVVAIACSARAESQYLWSPCDLATLEIADDVDQLMLAGRTMNPAFTLSSDRVFSGISFYIFNGDNVFDFTNGSTADLSSLIVMNAGTAAYLRGGCWRLANGYVYHGNWDGASDITFSLDDVSLTGVNTAYFACGNAGLFCATNGTEIEVSNAMKLAGGERNVVDLSAGSTVRLGGGASSYVACGSGAGGNVVRVRDSSIVQTSSTYNPVYFCASSPTNRLLFSGTAAVSCIDGRMFAGEAAKGNEIFFGDGAAYTNRSSLSVADVVGADGNILTFDNAVYHSSSQWSSFEFSPKGCDNKLVFRNATIVDPRWVRVGRDPGATGNTVRLEGAQCA